MREAIIKSVDFRAPAFKSSWDDAGYLAIILTSLAYQLSGDEKYAQATACLAQRAATFPRANVAPPDFSEAMRKMGFNVYSAGIHQLCSLPYAIAAFEKAGMDEKAVYAVPRVTNTPPPFEEVIKAENMTHEIGLAYQASIAQGAPSDVAGGFSNLILMESGKPLGPAHSAHAASV